MLSSPVAKALKNLSEDGRMRSSIQTNRTLRLAVLTSFMLAACYRPSPPPSKEYEPLQAALSSEYPLCADLSGTFALTPNSLESGLFTRYLLPPHQMDMVQITRAQDSFFLYRLKMHKARFIEQVATLQKSSPVNYARWRALITQWQKEKQAKQETSVTEREILELGPLPERGGLLTPSLCKAFWGEVESRNGGPVGLVETTDDVNGIATETLLSRSTKGALLFRYDNYQTFSIIFGGTARSRLINSAYAKLDPVLPAQFAWDLNDETAPRAQFPGRNDEQTDPTASNTNPADQAIRQTNPGDQATRQTRVDGETISAVSPYVETPAIKRPAKLAAILVDLQQIAIMALPSTARVSEFVVDKTSPNYAIKISLKGTTNSNAEVSELLRALDQYEQLGSVELVGVERPAKNTVAFEIYLKLVDQTH
jgi:hypothetical protein